ncbi:MAG: phosphatidate cytidylyltransferase [Firmicutes bacterium]|nr:phosphatidate cytidylyltransferase [Bacillota bacterium]
MKKRIISAVIGVILLLSIVSIGGLLFKASILVVTLIGLYEFNNATKVADIKALKFLTYLLPISLFIISIFEKYNYIQKFIIIYTLALLIMMVVSNKIKPTNIAFALLGTIYVSVFLFHINFLEGSPLIWLVFIIAWATDTFAYFFGQLFGKRKLCPRLSPKKTIEGAIGGVIGSFILTLIYLKVFNIPNLILLSVLSILGSILSQIGDLAASKIKRTVGIKDFGNIMPGHGGVLDRFDSIIFISPFIYYYIEIFI